MKRAKLLFPLMFVLALAATAFTQRASSLSRRDTTVYYEDDLYHTCNAYITTDGQCITDYASYQCSIYIIDEGNYMPVWQQNGLGINCFQPYYSYTQNP